MRVFTILKDICLKLGMVSDYVVETGTSGIWNYRKWASGTAECWCFYASKMTQYCSALSGYGYALKLDFPPGFFIDSPVTDYAVKIGNGFSTPAGARSYAEYASLLSISNVGTSNVDTGWNVHAIGRWK